MRLKGISVQSAHFREEHESRGGGKRRRSSRRRGKKGIEVKERLKRREELGRRGIKRARTKVMREAGGQRSDLMQNSRVAETERRRQLQTKHINHFRNTIKRIPRVNQLFILYIKLLLELYIFTD